MFDLQDNLNKVLGIKSDYNRYNLDQLQELFAILTDMYYNYVLSTKDKRLRSIKLKNKFFVEFNELYINVQKNIDIITIINIERLSIRSISNKLNNDYMKICKLIAIDHQNFEMGKAIEIFISKYHTDYMKNCENIKNFVGKYKFNPIINGESFKSVEEINDKVKFGETITQINRIIENSNLNDNIKMVLSMSGNDLLSKLNNYKNN